MRAPAPHGHVLVARLDSVGDILLAGPAVRAVAASAERVTMLVGRGRGAVARLLPGVDDVIEYAAPWVVPDPGALDAAAVDTLVREVREAGVDAGLILTSFHQSPLPLALLLRLAGVGWLGAISEDYPGSLLDLRHQMPVEPADVPESERALSLARAAGFTLDGPATLAVRGPLPDVGSLVGEGDYLVYHPGADAPARRPGAEQSRATVAALVEAGHRVVVTGSPAESTLTGFVAGGLALDLTGAVDLAGLAAVLGGAEVVVAPNTGPAHLAAAVGTPVVSLFAPVVPPERWAPYGVPVVLLGDQSAPCRLTRARHCPVAGHPCLDAVSPASVVAAVASLRRTPPAGTPAPARPREVDHVS
ncbi:ADP-heptose:LPS heptosyltransferase [Microlunatus sagamiharensis]|uniref:ADP-heptose:LPS heptosyltransferase n=1 Tax=Microlunatus sagamiharensis TaxID=546874 RepID=A0A1H2NF14_9ACTN|nr:glycosyltransferase family 9 protein [Microlunatus sagamiharensis]SDV03868.1 ADP-heptose:LPS heptosyltransferase [Microlunatus sagamiharensis]